LKTAVRVGTLRFVERHRCKDGRLLWAEINSTPEYDNDGILTGFFGISRDVTEHKLAENALYENRNLLHSIINAIPDAVFEKDLEGRFKLFNVAAARFVNKSETEVLGRDNFALFPPDIARELMAMDRQVIEGGELISYEEVVTDQDGSFVKLWVTKGPIYGADGKPIGLFGISRDITERNRLLDELKESQQRLAGIIEGTSSPFHK
jgi:PAS domain S-box-containing protein